MKFFYNNKVKVINGFYTGQVGLIKEYSTELFSRKITYQVSIVLDERGNTRYLEIDENDLEKVN